MLTAVSLICNPARPALDAALIATARSAAGAAGLEPRDAVVLCEGVAVELECAGSAVAEAAAGAVRAALGGAPVDVIVHSAQARRKRLLVADMDSTIIGQECIDELADFAGLGREISAITDRAMRGEIDFEAALLARVAMLKGLDENALHETFQTRISLNPGARTLVRTMKASGARAALVSGGFTYFVARVAEAAGFDDIRANDLVIDGGVLSGDVARPIQGRAAKREALRAIARECGLRAIETLAVGDGANDLDMLAEAGLGIAFRAKPSVAATARARIDHGDLTALLYAQGYRRDEFVE
jgi:phosphoserine phosphatase